VRLIVSSELPAIIVEPARLELALVNIVSNGIKYADLNKPDPFVEIASKETDDGRCAIVVRDNGIGIAAADRQTVFDRFVRAHRDRDGELGVGGVGLGLSIVRECIEAVHGTIEMDSVEDVGTTFVLTLPVRPQ
jgi:signal transduction histidine kinase